MSDLVQYNFRMERRNEKKFIYKNINDVVLDKITTRLFYQKRSKRKVWALIVKFQLLFLDLRVRDAVFLPSNYTRIWDELTSVYPEVFLKWCSKKTFIHV